jgi:hypothetical protein
LKLRAAADAYFSRKLTRFVAVEEKTLFTKTH